ncbi:MAG TPA: cold shock domain-containing protein [Chloroflexi bacterium]|nr:cold shock domain-containing protein [Chloroflexota bacterium]
MIQSSGDEIFFHRSGIVAEGPERFKDGAQVTYRVKSTARGPQAVEVALSDAD